MNDPHQDPARQRFIQAGKTLAAERAKEAARDLPPDTGRPDPDAIPDTIEGLHTLNPG